MWVFFNHEKTPQNSYQYSFFQFYIQDFFFSKQKHLNLFFHITLTFAQINLDKWLAYVRKKMSGLIFFFAEFSNFFFCMCPLCIQTELKFRAQLFKFEARAIINIRHLYIPYPRQYYMYKIQHNIAFHYMNIFGSKSSRWNNIVKIARKFLHLPQILAGYIWFFFP